MKKIKKAISEKNLLAILSLIMIFGSLIYFFYKLNGLGVALTLILSAGTFYFIRPYLKITPWPVLSREPEGKIDYFILGIFTLATAAAWTFLIKGRSGAALISPWQTVSPWLFFAYALSTFALLTLLFRAKANNRNRWLLGAHYALSFSVAATVYKIGYGFDPFIHQASMEMITHQGFILPKTPIYLGEYSLITIISRFSGLSVYLLNKFLVPVAAALLLPGAIKTLGASRGRTVAALLGGLLILIFPFSFLTVSTPQNFAYLFLILTLLYSLSGQRFLSLLLALATFAIHPIAGLPILSFWAFRELNYRRHLLSARTFKRRRLLTFFGSLLSLPLAFAIISNQSLLKLRLSLNGFKSLDFWPAYSGNLAPFYLNFPYLFTFLLWPGFIALAIYGAYRWRNFENEKSATWLTIGALAASWMFTASLSFDFLIDYEQADYLNRLVLMIALFMSPWVLAALGDLASRAREKNNAAKITFILAGTLIITSSFYLSYPRQDQFVNSRGYSVSEADLEAVRLINEDAAGADYVVLANQQTSVAALKESGFGHYFDTPSGPVFFYPIPTGGPLYQYYLAWVNEGPQEAIIDGVKDLTQAQKIYLVINRYWYRSDRLIRETSLKALDSWVTGDKEAYIFRLQ
ncbi:MAG: hypothetical protein ACOX6C_02120 [Patescibacteria group bacterium]|jgi:hypothetical protein